MLGLDDRRLIARCNIGRYLVRYTDMGLRGPQRKPAHLRLFEGNPGKRKIEEKELDIPKVLELPVPVKFKGDSRAELWTEVTKELALINGLCAVDTRMLELYVDTLFRLHAAGKFLDRQGSTAPMYNRFGDQIGEKTSPYFTQYTILSAQALRLAQNFGMTPSARARIVSFGKGKEPEKPHDPFE